MKVQHSPSSSMLVLLAFEIIIFDVDVNFAGTSDMGGMYDLVIQRIVECEGIDSPNLNFSTQINNPEEGNKYLSGNFTFNLEMGSSETMVVDVYKWGQNAGFQKNAYHLEKKSPCSCVETDFPNIFEQLFKAMGISSCPITKGTYELQHMDLEGWTLKNFSNMPFGIYYLIICIKKDNDVSACLQIYVDVNQKAKQNPTVP